MGAFQVIIVGAGPAGIFAALELAAAGLRDILILEKGGSLSRRRCPGILKGKGCRDGPVCSVLSGWGGAGAYSDGKLTLSARVGGFLDEYLAAGVLDRLIAEVDGRFLRFGAPAERYEPTAAVRRSLERKASRAGLTFVASPVRHLGTDGSRTVLQRMKRHLEGKADVRFGETAVQVLLEEGRAGGVMTDTGRLYRSRFVILAPGRGGATWLAQETARLGLTSVGNPVDIGVRVEIPARVLEPITREIYEAKLWYRSALFRDQVRTFCMCPYGEVVMESIDGLHTVNGQSYRGRRTANTNFAILVSTRFTEPFHEPITYGRHIAGLANLLSGGILVQRLGDLDAGRRSTPERLRDNPVRPTLSSAAPGDLSFALPYRHLTDIREMLAALDRMAPGVADPATLLYGVETKFYSIRLGLSRDLETGVPNLFAVGDGAGVSRSLVQAAASGLVAARAIMARSGG